jgi:predicted Zn-dependent protease
MIAKNNLAAVSLLLNNQMSQAHQMAREVYQANPTNEVFASTYAWSLHVQGKSAEALQTMEKLAPRHLENPSIALYYGALLATNRQPEKAKLFLDIAARAQLLPEEKALLQSVSAAVK